MNATTQFVRAALLMAVTASLRIHGQNTAGPCVGGTISFVNNSTAAAVTNALTMQRVPAGRTFLAALYYLPDTGVEPTEEDFDQGTVLAPSASFLIPGIFGDGTRITPGTTSGGSEAWFQVRVWESVFGPNDFGSYEEARDAQVVFAGRRPLSGRSNIIKVRTGNPCAVPPSVPGLLSWGGLRGVVVGTDVVLDHVPPLVFCPTNVVATLAPNQSAVPVNFAATAADDVAPAPVIVCTPPSGTAFPAGASPVTCTAWDACGNRSQCGFTVVVSVLEDHIAPVITCPTNITVAVTTGQVSRVVTFSAVTVDDLDPAPSLSCAPPSGSTFPVGLSSVVCSARDWAGNTSQCSFSVTIDVSGDSTPPAIICPTNITVNTTNSPALPVVGFAATAHDDLDPAPVVTCNPASGSVFPSGLTAVLCTARDWNSNTSQCSFMVTVNVLEDRIAPVITCPGPISVTIITGQVSRLVSFAATVADDLDPAPVVACTPPSGFAFPAGLTSVLCIARDWGANTSQCSFTVRVHVQPDTTPPSITCSTNMIFGVYTGQYPQVVQFVATATDDVDSSPSVLCQPASGYSFPLGQTPVICTARDFSGNTNACGFSVTLNRLEDLDAPALTCPSNLAVRVYAGETSRPVQFVVVARDEIDPAPELTCQPSSGAPFSLGQTRVTCVARDFSDNAADCSFSVTLEVAEDRTPPVLHCREVNAYLEYGLSQAVSFAPGVTDDMDLAPVVTCLPPSGSLFPLGRSAVVCTARDRGSNASTCGFTINVSVFGGGGCVTITVANNSQTRINNALTGLPIPAGSNFLAVLYWLPNGDTPPPDAAFDFGEALLPAVPFFAPGLFNGGTRIMPYGGGIDRWFQVRVWESVFGSNVFTSFEAARNWRTAVGGRLPLLALLPPVRARTGDQCLLPPTVPSSLAYSGLQGGSTQARSCAAPPQGLVGWWTGDGQTEDLAGGSPGTLVGATYGTGKSGLAFRFDSARAAISLPEAPHLRSQDFTIEAWVQRASTARVTLDDQENGALFAWPPGGYGFALAGDGRLFLTQVGRSAVFSTLTVTNTEFHHVAVTKSGSNVVIYLDGVAEAVEPYDPGFVFEGTPAIGARGGDFFNTFWGTIDEVSVYHRALSEVELQGLAGSSLGKCLAGIPPTIVLEPQSQHACLGHDIALIAAAAGSPPLSYQWQFEGQPLPGATGPNLTLEAVTASMAGRYELVVTNAAGAVTSVVAAVTVETRPPTVTIEGSAVVRVECLDAFVDPGATAEDACGATLPVAVDGIVDPHSPGTYTLTYRATDRVGQTAQASRTVVVADTAPPTLSCPPDLTVEFATCAGALVLFEAPGARDVCGGAVTVHCTPSSGAQFPIGLTSVQCVATDASGNSDSCQFGVRVLGARTTAARLKERLMILRRQTTDLEARRLFRQAIDHLKEVVGPEAWMDDTHVQARSGQAVFAGLRKAVQALEALKRKPRASVPDAELLSVMARLVQVARLVAAIQLQDAETVALNSSLLDSARSQVSQGDARAARADFDLGIVHYGNGWRFAARLVVRVSSHLSGKELKLMAQGFPGETYAIEASTNLVDWVVIGVLTANSSGMAQMEKLDVVFEPGCFYRAKIAR